MLQIELDLSLSDVYAFPTMKLIAHRGNTKGKIVERENAPDYLLEALGAGYDIEVDLWMTDDGLFLGHDAPQYVIDDAIFSTLNPARTWWHAKNAAALEVLARQQGLNFFSHEEDPYVLTSRGYIWVHTKTPQLLVGSICVLPEERANNEGIELCSGVCSDTVEAYGSLKG